VPKNPFSPCRNSDPLSLRGRQVWSLTPPDEKKEEKCAFSFSPGTLNDAKKHPNISEVCRLLQNDLYYF
jgi:hypothetical protein